MVHPAPTEALPLPGQPLSDAQVTAFARLALAGIEREFPNKPADLLTRPDSLQLPRVLHPVFYGCYDWHSAIHAHWLLARLLKRYPASRIASAARALLSRQLTADKLRTEADYFTQKSNHNFERMYGWAWLLRLAAELRTFDDPDARAWAAHLAPLEHRLVDLTKAYLPRLTYPIRSGVHPDTAFALAQILDYARQVPTPGNLDLEHQIVAYAREKYLPDRACSAAFEPSGEDFFSPSLNEADLLRRILPPSDFASWLTAFLPELAPHAAGASPLLTPAVVSDIADARIGHLAGLNLSRAWTQRGILSALPADDPRRPLLETSVRAHAAAGLGCVFSGHYEGEHWLATFAVYLLDS